MKKKIISLMTAAVLVVSMGTTVFAVESPTAGQISQVTPSTTFSVGEKELSGIDNGL